MKLLFVFAAVLVAVVTSSAIGSGYTTKYSTEPETPETGLIGYAGFDLVGTFFNDLWIAGDDIQQSKDFLSPAVGSLLKPVGDGGLLVSDDVIGELGGDTVSRVGITVERTGDKVETIPIIGGLLTGIIAPGGRIVEKLGGDKLKP